MFVMVLILPQVRRHLAGGMMPPLEPTVPLTATGVSIKPKTLVYKIRASDFTILSRSFWLPVWFVCEQFPFFYFRVQILSQCYISDMVDKVFQFGRCPPGCWGSKSHPAVLTPSTWMVHGCHKHFQYEAKKMNFRCRTFVTLVGSGTMDLPTWNN
jgi:hypothetical protein